MEKSEPVVTIVGLKILRLFLLEYPRPQAGYAIAKALDIDGSTSWAQLRRFEAAGWMFSRWEQVAADWAGRPPRRLYALTPEGANQARAMLEALSLPPPP